MSEDLFVHAVFGIPVLEIPGEFDRIVQDCRTFVTTRLSRTRPGDRRLIRLLSQFDYDKACRLSRNELWDNDDVRGPDELYGRITKADAGLRDGLLRLRPFLSQGVHKRLLNASKKSAGAYPFLGLLSTSAEEDCRSGCGTAGDTLLFGVGLYGLVGRRGGLLDRALGLQRLLLLSQLRDVAAARHLPLGWHTWAT